MKPTRSRSSFTSTAARKTIGAMDILEWVGRESGRNDPAHRGMAD